jgi:16S rRNA processing protein RimM
LIFVMLPGLEAAVIPADAIEVGRILDAWGIKGWFKVLPYSADSEALFSVRCWFVLPSEKGAKTFAGAGVLKIKEVKLHSDTVVACAHAVVDRSSADSLRGARIFISKANFPAVKNDEYYWVDLIGLEVINRQGQKLGHVVDLLSTGPQTVLVIDDAQAVNAEQRMIPFVSIYIDDVSLAERRILVDWQLDY